MFYRRKIILGLLELFDVELERIQLQKLLFLFSQAQENPNYEFVPFKFGCFSFQANADLKTMKKYGLVRSTQSGWQKVTPENFTASLKKGDLKILRSMKILYENTTTDELITLTYRKYPYYAINSQIADNKLNAKEAENVRSCRPINTEECLYTIGYEGISLENYLNKLLRADVKVLCDVRKNSFSMKFGFSKAQLKNACEGVGILFYHLPDLGIDGNQRKELNSQSDYDQLFDTYRETTLQNTDKSQKFILDLLQENHRVALTCFEAQSCQCHRSHLANSIAALPEFRYSLVHI